MFVCILFCGFNGTTVLKRSSVHEPSSDYSSTFQHQIIFYLTRTNKWILCYSTRDVSFVTGMSVQQNVLKKKLTFQWRRSRIYRGRSDLITYMAGANARIRFIYFHIWMRPETDLRILESMRFFPAYTVMGHIRSVPHGRKKIGIGSLEPCSVNAAIDTQQC